MLAHNTGTSSQYDPCQQGADNGVADARPGGSNPVFPSELSGVAHEYNGGKIGGSVSKSGQPGTDRSSTQNKTVDVCGVFAAVKADADQDREVNQ